MARLRRLQLDRRDLPVHRRSPFTQQSNGRRRGQHPCDAGEADTSDPAEPGKTRKSTSRRHSSGPSGLDTAAVGNRYFQGDNANQNKQLGGYWLVNLHATYQVTREMQFFGLINNLFKTAATRLFGTFFDPQSVANVGLPVVLTDHRTEVLGAPLSVYGGIRITF